MSWSSANPFASLNGAAADNDGGGWRQAPQKKKLGKNRKRAKQRKPMKADPTYAPEPLPKEPTPPARSDPEPFEEEVKNPNALLMDTIISYFAEVGSNHVNKEQRENDLVAVLEDLQNEGRPLQDPNINSEFRKEVLHRIHLREEGRFQVKEDEAEQEVQNDEDSSVPESVEDQPRDQMSLSDLTMNQVTELNFNEVITESILKDWIEKISSKETSEEFRKELNKAGLMGFLSESILTSEINRTEESPRQIRDYKDLLVQLFDHLLQPLGHENYGWFTEQLIEIATNLKKSKALAHNSQTKKLVMLLKNCFMYLEKQTKHGEKKVVGTPFTPPSKRLFRRIASEHLVKLNMHASVEDLDKVAEDWHGSRDMVTRELSKQSEEEGPSHKDRIDLFRQIWTQSEEGSKGVRADLKSAMRNSNDTKEEMERIKNEIYSQRDKKLERKKIIERERMNLEARRKSLQQELQNIEQNLTSLNTEHINIQEEVRKMEAIGEPKLREYQKDMDLINKRINEKNSEQSCFEGVGGIAKRVINQLENKSNGTKTEQAKFRAKMNQEFLHHGQMYEHSLERLKTRMDSEKVLLNDSVAKYRDLEAQSYLSNREIENLRRMRESHVALLDQVEESYKLVMQEYYETQVELKRHLLNRTHTASPSPRASGGWPPFQSPPPAMHTTPQVIVDSHQEQYPRKPPRNVGSIGGGTWGSGPMLFKQPSLSKPPQATYTAYAAPPPTASLQVNPHINIIQTLDTFQDQIPQDPIVDTFDDQFEDKFEDTFEDPLETTTKEESPIIAPTQMEENPEPIRAQAPVQPSPPARAPQSVVAAPPRVAAASGWNKIVANKKANPTVGRIKQTQGVRLPRDRGSGGQRSRGNGRRRNNRDSNRRR